MGGVGGRQAGGKLYLTMAGHRAGYVAALEPFFPEQALSLSLSLSLALSLPPSLYTDKLPLSHSLSDPLAPSSPSPSSPSPSPHLPLSLPLSLSRSPTLSLPALKPFFPEQAG